MAGSGKAHQAGTPRSHDNGCSLNEGTDNVDNELPTGVGGYGSVADGEDGEDPLGSEPGVGG